MTGDEAETLGRRALSAGFRWGAEGALYRTGAEPQEEWRCFAADDGDGLGPWFVSGEGDVYGAEEESAPLAMIFNPWPDFRDAATIGVLVEQVRERWGQPMHSAPALTVPRRTVCEWRVWSASGLNRYWAGATEAEAWVAALEDCPET